MKPDGETQVMDVSALRMREATIAAGLWMSLGVGLLGGVYVALTWQRPNRSELLILFISAVVTAVIVYFVPREKIVRSRIREPFFLMWTLTDFAMLVIGTLADGGTASPLVLVFFLPIVFSSMSYPLVSVAIVGVASVCSYLVVALTAGGASTYFQLGFAFALICTAAMSAWQAQNHNRQHRALARASRSDPLTGCLNRRGFEERAVAEIADMTRQGRRGAVVVLDIDHFKPVNDTFGHAAGDELLCWFAKTLEATVRTGDAVGRLGGDEFAVLMGEVGPSEVLAGTARLQAALGSRAPASLGVALFPDDGPDLETLARCADARLYASRRGRATAMPLRSPAPEGPRESAPPHQVEGPDRRSGEEASGEEAALEESLLGQIAASVVATDLNGVVISWNSGAEALYDWTETEALGRNARELIVPENAEAAERLGEEVRREGSWDGELLVRRRDGSLFTVYVRNRLIRDVEGNPTAIVGVAVDISARVAAETELLHSRNYARAVTEFMGEGLLTLDTEGRVTYANRAAEALVGWTAAELRGRSIGELIGPSGREPPSPFAETPFAETPFAEALASEKALRIEDAPFRTGGGGALAVACTATPFHTAEGLRGCIVIFQDITARKRRDEEHRRDAETLAVIDRVERALLEERFVLHAQPIIELGSGEVVKHELLLRMLEPDGTLVAPGEFLPVAERYALVGEIDWWVIKQAAELAGSGWPVQLNLSARSVGDPDVLEHIERCVRRWEVPPGLIVVEITETAVVEDQQAARSFAEGLHALGCEIALDDFGTGYGTLSYLKQIPVDYLKLDIEFVRDLASSTASRHVVQAVLALARDFKLKTIAEGVEDARTLELLCGLDVDFAQGFHIARPTAFAKRPGDLQQPPAVDLRGLVARPPARRAPAPRRSSVSSERGSAAKQPAG